jgi:hypothetical protein
LGAALAVSAWHGDAVGAETAKGDDAIVLDDEMLLKCLPTMKLRGTREGDCVRGWTWVSGALFVTPQTDECTGGTFGLLEEALKSCIKREGIKASYAPVPKRPSCQESIAKLETEKADLKKALDECEGKLSACSDKKCTPVPPPPCPAGQVCRKPETCDPSPPRCSCGSPVPIVRTLTAEQERKDLDALNGFAKTCPLMPPPRDGKGATPSATDPAASSGEATAASSASRPLEMAVAVGVVTNKAGQMLMNNVCARMQPFAKGRGPEVHCSGETGVAQVWLSGVPYRTGEWSLDLASTHLQATRNKLHLVARSMAGEVRQWARTFGETGILVEVQGSASAEPLLCAGLARSSGASQPIACCGPDSGVPCLYADGSILGVEGRRVHCKPDAAVSDRESLEPDQVPASEILADLRGRDAVRILQRVCRGPCPFKVVQLEALPVEAATSSGSAAAQVRNVTILVSPHPEP